MYSFVIPMSGAGNKDADCLGWTIGNLMSWLDILPASFTQSNTFMDATKKLVKIDLDTLLHERKTFISNQRFFKDM